MKLVSEWSVKCVMPAKKSSATHPPPEVQYCHVNSKSREVRGVPSDQRMPGLMFHVMLVKSSATPPF